MVCFWYLKIDLVLPEVHLLDDGRQPVERLRVGPDRDGAGEGPVVVVVLDQADDDGRARPRVEGDDAAVPAADAGAGVERVVEVDDLVVLVAQVVVVLGCKAATSSDGRMCE